MSNPPGKNTSRERARLAAAVRHGHDPEILAERRGDLAAAKAADQIEYGLRVEQDVDRIVSWLTEETLAKLAVLFGARSKS